MVMRLEINAVASGDATKGLEPSFKLSEVGAREKRVNLRSPVAILK